MNYQKEFIINFAKRTRNNLEFIESAQLGGESVFEVTQLCNSLLGLLVFPREHYMEGIPETPLSELVEQGWPMINTISGQLPQDTLKDLMRMLRNSIAHCNVEFLADHDNSINGIRVWNARGGLRTWEAELSIADLRSIALKFVELIEKETNIK